LRRSLVRGLQQFPENTEYIEAALAACGRKLIVVDQTEMKDDLLPRHGRCADVFLRSPLWSPGSEEPGNQGIHAMIIAHKIALDPHEAQRSYYARACGTARFAYNWALAEWNRQYFAGEKPSEASSRRKLNSIKDEQFPWMREVTKNAPQQAIKNLGTAFKNFFAGTGKYPQFKKKGQHDSFRADNGQDKRHPNVVEVKGKRVKLPVIGWVKMREALRFDGKIKSAVVSCTADRWFVSLTIEIEHVASIRKKTSGSRGKGSRDFK
jgi:Helix-turn-helix domain